MKQSKKPADLRHPFGYGAEIFFWAFSRPCGNRKTLRFSLYFSKTVPALLGLIVAFAGVAGTHMLGLEWADGTASMLISAILAEAAVLLAQETKGPPNW
jgi:divalent metal cation (Fe/Co/Zn/Cd) transporter